eukprot:11823902-Heterocapsa_arctica.AAC.1
MAAARASPKRRTQILSRAKHQQTHGGERDREQAADIAKRGLSLHQPRTCHAMRPCELRAPDVHVASPGSSRAPSVLLQQLRTCRAMRA